MIPFTNAVAYILYTSPADAPIMHWNTPGSGISAMFNILNSSILGATLIEWQVKIKDLKLWSAH
jgi:hypothetical protein